MGRPLPANSCSHMSHTGNPAAEQAVRPLALWHGSRPRPRTSRPAASSGTGPDRRPTSSTAGHEIGLHGYLHRAPAGLSVEAEREEIERGVAALDRHGVKAVGYRSPGWESTRSTPIVCCASTT